MFFECITCKSLNNGCHGPDFSRKSIPDVIGWFKAYCSHFGIAHSAFAKQCNMAEGTIHRIFSGASTDIKFETFRAMYVGVFGNEPPAMICPDPDGSVAERLASRVQHLEQELADTKQLASHAHESHTAAAVRQDAQTRSLRRALTIVSSLLIVVLFAIIGVLVYDLTQPGIGYFGR